MFSRHGLRMGSRWDRRASASRCNRGRCGRRGCGGRRRSTILPPCPCADTAKTIHTFSAGWGLHRAELPVSGLPLTFGVETKLDGQPIFTGQNISLGSHVFTVIHPKAEPYGINFSAWYGSNGLGEIKLKRSQGTLSVQATPSAGTITITGPEFSTTLNDVAATNLTVPTDAYEIRADYPHWTELKNVTIFNQLTAACVFSPQFGVVHLTCNRDGATYVLQFENGQSADSGNLPAMVTGLPPGKYQISAAYHHRQIEKSFALAAGVMNEVPLEFALGAARLESVPTGADVLAVDGSNLGQTPLDLTDLPPQTAQYNLSLLGYEPVSVRVAIIADQTTTMHTNLLSVRFGEALSEARQYLAAGNNEKALQATMEALGIKADVLQAYAMDTAGNSSTTNSVSFDYVVTNQLDVRAIGLGTLSPNYSNAWLEIGRNYSMTATPASGFVFTNWITSINWLGGVMTNKASVQFMMQSNLTLQVTFADVTIPTITITAPTNLQKLTNALANVKGTASDNWGVNNVWYQLNGGAWNPAITTNTWTNWSVTLPLVLGTNTVKAYAMDLGGNMSTTNGVSMISSNTFVLQLDFTLARPMATNGLNVSLQVSHGINGTIQISSNLVNWLALTNFVGTNSPINFRDSAATNFNKRFYRAVTP